MRGLTAQTRRLSATSPAQECSRAEALKIRPAPQVNAPQKRPTPTIHPQIYGVTRSRNTKTLWKGKGDKRPFACRPRSLVVYTREGRR